MLPVQTVMIRYMVLVYRWGSGWLGAVGAWGGSLGSTVMGDALAEVHSLRARKGPADEGPAGPSILRILLFNSRKYSLAY